MYTIKINYSTGNSFGIHNESETVGYVWKDIDDVKATLQNIKEHNESYKELNQSSYQRSKTHDEVNKEVITKGFYIKPTEKYHDASSWQYRVKVVDKYSIEDKHIDAFWVGYFENIQSAEIVLHDELNDDDTVIYF